MASSPIVTVGFRCPPDLYKEIARQAKASKVTVSRWLRDAARDQVRIQRGVYNAGSTNAL